MRSTKSLRDYFAVAESQPTPARQNPSPKLFFPDRRLNVSSQMIKCIILVLNIHRTPLKQPSCVWAAILIDINAGLMKEFSNFNFPNL